MIILYGPHWFESFGLRNWCSTLGIWTLKDLDVALSTRPVDPVIRARKDDCGRCGTKHLKERIDENGWIVDMMPILELTVDLNLDFISQNRPVQADVPIYGCSVHRWQDGNFCRRCGQRRQTSLSRAKNATSKAKAQREAAVDLNKKLCGVPQVSHQGTCMEVQKHQSPRVIQKQILCEARTLGVLR